MTRIGPGMRNDVVPGLQSDEGALLLVDKPAGWTSFDVVKKIRTLFRLRKVGHAGTLDPLATGLLLVCTGKRTKTIEEFVGLEKEYEGGMFLGARTSSFDAGTPVVERHSVEHINDETVRSVFGEFAGPQEQLPPMWSAVKVNGKRLYALARQGKTVERKTRQVIIHSLAPTRIAIPEVDFSVVCSKGTYVRALVDDIGQRLGCGAYLRLLRRTRIGPYHLSDALTIEELVAQKHASAASGGL
ncbi:MAG: tRNA pseudouridine(55) synthase TruB [Bacteroidota bacterium]